MTQSANKIGNKFTFNAWNFIEAQNAIKNFLDNQKKYKLTADQVQLLVKIEERLSAYENTFHDFARQEIITNATNEINLDEMLENYQEQIYRGIEVIKVAIDNNILKYVTRKSSNESTDLNYTPTDFDSLQDCLKKCCEGIGKRLSDLQKKAVNKLDTTKKICQVAESFGAICVPFSQAVELLAGTRYENQQTIDAEYKGSCVGYVKHWMEQIQKKGCATFFVPFDQEIDKKQQERILMQYHEAKGEVREYIIDQMKQINDSHLYLLVMRPEKGSGHACGIRQIPGTDAIEFIDPNYGGFLFPNKKAFVDWFLYLFSIYKLDLSVHYLRIIPLADQPKSATSILLKYKPKQKAIDVERFNRICFLAQEFYEEKKKSSKFTGEMQATAKYYSKMLLDLLPTFLHKIRTIDACNDLKNTIEKMVFLFQPEKHPTDLIKHLFSPVSNVNVSNANIWENNKDVKRMEQMINDKMRQLSQPTQILSP